MAHVLPTKLSRLERAVIWCNSVHPFFCPFDAEPADRVCTALRGEGDACGRDLRCEADMYCDADITAEESGTCDSEDP